MTIQDVIQRLKGTRFYVSKFEMSYCEEDSAFFGLLEITDVKKKCVLIREDLYSDKYDLLFESVMTKLIREAVCETGIDHETGQSSYCSQEHRDLHKWLLNSLFVELKELVNT